MNAKKSSFPIVVLAVLFVGLALSIMQHFTQSGRSQTIRSQPNGLQVAAAAEPTRNLTLTAAAVIPSSNITTTPAPPPKAQLVTKQPTRPSPPITSYTFTDPVPAADSPEFTADGMNACFSQYTRTKNEAERTCKGEWYPADQAPRPYDEFWCATNAGGVGWLPVRFFDGRSTQTVIPYGSLNRCD